MLRTTKLAMPALFVLFSLTLATAQEVDPAVTPPITLNLTGVHPRDAIEELSKQTGVMFQFWPEKLYEQRRGFGNQLPTSIDVNVDKESFWTALEAICSPAKLMPYNMGNNRAGVTLREAHGEGLLASRPQSPGPHSLIMVNSINRSHSISYHSGAPQVQRSCSLSLEAYVDPRLRLVKYQDRPTVETADDSNGQSIHVPPQGQTHQSWSDSSSNWHVQGLSIPLNYDPETSKKLAKLKGSIRVGLAGEFEKIEIEELSQAKGVEKEVAGVKLVVNEITLGSRNVEMKIDIVRTEMSKEQFQEIYRGLFQAMQFHNAEGKPLGNNSGGGGGGGDTYKYTISASFQDEANRPVKFVWSIPTRVDEVELPFEFSDLELP